MALVDQVMSTEPYASRAVFWVVDNGAFYRGWTAAARLSEAWPNAAMVHLPVHASWLNQVEHDFSVIQRKPLVPDDFTDLGTLARQIPAFEDATTRPPAHSTGSSTAATSTGCCTGSPTMIQQRPAPRGMIPRRINGPDH